MDQTYDIGVTIYCRDETVKLESTVVLEVLGMDIFATSKINFCILFNLSMDSPMHSWRSLWRKPILLVLH